jgi:hypothetical protein
MLLDVMKNFLSFRMISNCQSWNELLLLSLKLSFEQGRLQYGNLVYYAFGLHNHLISRRGELFLTLGIFRNSSLIT